MLNYRIDRIPTREEHQDSIIIDLSELTKLSKGNITVGHMERDTVVGIAAIRQMGTNQRRHSIIEWAEIITAVGTVDPGDLIIPAPLVTEIKTGSIPIQLQQHKSPITLQNDT